jgi:hypothetical protein
MFNAELRPGFEQKEKVSKVRFGGTPKVRPGLAYHTRRVRYPEWNLPAVRLALRLNS